MSHRYAQIAALIVSALVVVSVLSVPLCVATACNRMDTAGMASANCSDMSPSLQSCSHVMQSLATVATAQDAPRFEAQVASLPAPAALVIGSERSSSVQLADEPPRTLSSSPLRI